MRVGKKRHSLNVPAVRADLNSTMTLLSSPRLPFFPLYHSSDVQARRSPSTQAATSQQLHTSNTSAYPRTPTHTHTRTGPFTTHGGPHLQTHTGLFRICNRQPTHQPLATIQGTMRPASGHAHGSTNRAVFRTTSQPNPSSEDTSTRAIVGQHKWACRRPKQM